MTVGDLGTRLDPSYLGSFFGSSQRNAPFTNLNRQPSPRPNPPPKNLQVFIYSKLPSKYLWVLCMMTSYAQKLTTKPRLHKIIHIIWTLGVGFLYKFASLGFNSSENFRFRGEKWWNQLVRRHHSVNTYTHSNCISYCSLRCCRHFVSGPQCASFLPRHLLWKTVNPRNIYETLLCFK